MRRFVILWCGQLISGLGSSLSGFALGVWLYQQTGSATQFAITTLFYILPYALLASLAGTLVDRWDRRRTMILADTGQALITLLLVLLLSTHQLNAWLVYLAAAASACLGSFQGPAYGASVSLIVPKEQLTRTAGMGQISNAVNRLIAPILAGVLVVAVGLGGVLIIDLVSFGVGILAYLMVDIPQPPSVHNHEKAERTNLWQETMFGWRYLIARPGLLGYIIIGSALPNYFMGMANASTVPLVLSIAQADKVGLVLAIGSAGLLAGGLFMSVWGGPKQRMIGVLGFLALGGIGTIIAGWLPAISFIATGRALSSLGLAGGSSTQTALEQSKIAPDVQGRVFGTIGMLSLLFESLAYPSAGLLADRVFEPLMMGQSALAHTLGTLIGSGQGRGIGLMNITVGTCVIGLAVFGYLHPRIRQLETELPDRVP